LKKKKKKVFSFPLDYSLALKKSFIIKQCVVYVLRGARLS